MVEKRIKVGIDIFPKDIPMSIPKEKRKFKTDENTWH